MPQMPCRFFVLLLLQHAAEDRRLAVPQPGGGLDDPLAQVGPARVAAGLQGLDLGLQVDGDVAVEVDPGLDLDLHAHVLVAVLGLGGEGPADGWRWPRRWWRWWVVVVEARPPMLDWVVLILSPMFTSPVSPETTRTLGLASSLVSPLVLACPAAAWGSRNWMLLLLIDSEPVVWFEAAGAAGGQGGADGVDARWCRWGRADGRQQAEVLRGGLGHLQQFQVDHHFGLGLVQLADDALGDGEVGGLGHDGDGVQPLVDEHPQLRHEGVEDLPDVLHFGVGEVEGADQLVLVLLQVLRGLLEHHDGVAVHAPCRTGRSAASGCPAPAGRTARAGPPRPGCPGPRPRSAGRCSPRSSC